jgi:hypothetical protein
MKKLVVTILLGFVGFTLHAQNDIDALRYSLLSPTGSTAKSLSIGGAIGTVGADPSAALVNPAGLAQYRNSVFNASVGSFSVKNSSAYFGNNTNAPTVFRPNLPSINLVSTDIRLRKGFPAKKGWVNTNFLIGWNKVADFNRTISYKGTNEQSSYTDFVADYVGGLNASDLDANQEQLDRGFYYFENMFWYSYLIDSASNGSYFGNYDNIAPNQYQEGQIISRGGMNELNLALAGNYEHKVYFGAALNATNVRYEETNRFTEFDNSGTAFNYNSFYFTRNLETSGWGVNGRIGLIFRPSNSIRIGGTIHTPTLLRLTDEYFDELFVLQDDGTSDDLRTIDKEYDYNITTPMRYSAQATYLFGKQGFISAELESIDFSTMGVDADNDAFIAVNEQIVNKYKNAVNLKLGGEYVLDALRLRAGFMRLGNPLQNGEIKNTILTGGIGINDKGWSIDLGFAKHLRNDTYVPYNAPGIPTPAVVNSFNGTQLILSINNKF